MTGIQMSEANAISSPLLLCGTVLFLLGLVTGVFVQAFRNPRMGLSAHLAGLQSAVVLWVLGLMWPQVSLAAGGQLLLAGSAVFGMYALWLGLVIAAVFGASRVVPIAGAGYRASRSAEFVVAALMGSGSLAILVAMVILLCGLW